MIASSVIIPISMTGTKQLSNRTEWQIHIYEVGLIR